MMYILNERFQKECKNLNNMGWLKVLFVVSLNKSKAILIGKFLIVTILFQIFDFNHLLFTYKLCQRGCISINTTLFILCILRVFKGTVASKAGMF